MERLRGEARSGAAAAPAGGVGYVLALIGALVWFWQQAEGFWGYVLAVLKAMVWPALLVYEAFEHLAG